MALGLLGRELFLERVKRLSVEAGAPHVFASRRGAEKRDGGRSRAERGLAAMSSWKGRVMARPRSFLTKRLVYGTTGRLESQKGAVLAFWQAV